MDTNTLMLLAIAALNALAAYWTYQTRCAVAASAVNIQKIEMATNSMKDALVKAAGEEAHARGLKQGREER